MSSEKNINEVPQEISCAYHNIKEYYRKLNEKKPKQPELSKHYRLLEDYGDALGEGVVD